MPAFVGNKINRFVPVTQIADKHLVLLLLDISSENYYYQLNIKWVVYKYYTSIWVMQMSFSSSHQHSLHNWVSLLWVGGRMDWIVDSGGPAISAFN